MRPFRTATAASHDGEVVPESDDERVSDAAPAPFATPTGQPCPRQLRVDGSVEGTGSCYSCGSCLLLELAAWPSED